MTISILKQRIIAIGLILLVFPALVVAEVTLDAPSDCPQCEDWNRTPKAFRVYGNTYFVGTTELSSILIATNDGLILIDGAIPQTAPLIDANLRALGFAVADIKLILNSHAHHDHVGGIAALQRASQMHSSIPAAVAHMRPRRVVVSMSA